MWPWPIGQMVKMGLVEVLDRHLPRHWKTAGRVPPCYG